ncbi:MAG: formate dehydrogenase subunit gamma [Rhodospirillales bacterium]|nr:MAG: formate dehydrogenase subunit gamma [Rhodospirillales bacterium]
MKMLLRRYPVLSLLFLAAIGFSLAAVAVYAVETTRPALASTETEMPGGVHGTVSGADMWRAIRQGDPGGVAIPNPKAGVLIQSEGDNWRAWRNGPIAVVGAVAFWVMFLVVFGFHNIRGGIRIQHGRSGRDIKRFSFIERFAHWLTAGSFLILAVTGVNMIYGKHMLMPIIGHETFATLTLWGKYVHNYVAFAFMAGLVLIFVLWVRDNLWDRYDWNWIRKGGGLLIPTEHPPARKFNFGQKTMFWAVIVFGLTLSVTGINLLFPFQFADLHQMQWMQAIHGTASQIICMLMVAHIYVGTVGMEDAFRSMSTGYVDENWAKEHHRIWFEEEKAKEAAGAQEDLPAGALQAPAE